MLHLPRKSQVVSPTTDDFTKDFDVTNINDLNGPKFWKAWERAGGDPDEYIKETLPTFGIIGALLLTVSIPLTLSPISFAFSDPSDDISNKSSFVQLYSICLNLSTGLSLAMIILSMGVYQQYVNAYSRELRVDFAAKFGYVVSIFEVALVVDVLSLLASVLVGVAKTYDFISATIGIVLVGVFTLGSFLLYANITLINSNTYSKQMVKDIQVKVKEQEADVSDQQKVLQSIQEIQKQFSLLSAALEVVMKAQSHPPIPSGGNMV